MSGNNLVTIMPSSSTPFAQGMIPKSSSFITKTNGKLATVKHGGLHVGTNQLSTDSKDSLPHQKEAQTYHIQQNYKSVS